MLYYPCLECDGFKCDTSRCIPLSYICDGHLDCMDQSDEFNCQPCDNKSIYCGDGKCMNSKQVCDGIPDCPYGQDERNCSEFAGFLANTLIHIASNFYFQFV